MIRGMIRGTIRAAFALVLLASAAQAEERPVISEIVAPQSGLALNWVGNVSAASEFELGFLRVGTLAEEGREVSFAYDAQWIGHEDALGHPGAEAIAGTLVAIGALLLGGKVDQHGVVRLTRHQRGAIGGGEDVVGRGGDIGGGKAGGVVAPADEGREARHGSLLAGGPRRRIRPSTPEVQTIASSSLAALSFSPWLRPTPSRPRTPPSRSTSTQEWRSPR